MGTRETQTLDLNKTIRVKAPLHASVDIFARSSESDGIIQEIEAEIISNGMNRTFTPDMSEIQNLIKEAEQVLRGDPKSGTLTYFQDPRDSNEILDLGGVPVAKLPAPGSKEDMDATYYELKAMGIADDQIAKIQKAGFTSSALCSLKAKCRGTKDGTSRPNTGSTVDNGS